jgi:hypothetical protein
MAKNTKTFDKLLLELRDAQRKFNSALKNISTCGYYVIWADSKNSIYVPDLESVHLFSFPKEGAKSVKFRLKSMIRQDFNRKQRQLKSRFVADGKLLKEQLLKLTH